MVNSCFCATILTVLRTRTPGDDMAFDQYRDWNFYDRAFTRVELGDNGKSNPDLGSIFLNGVVRETVINNFADLNINVDTAIAIMDIRGHAAEPLVRSEYPERRGGWRSSVVLAHWIETQIIIGSYHHSPHWMSRCIQAMALRGDEVYPEEKEAQKKCDELLGLRMAYEVNVALTMLLRMDTLLTEFNAIAETWTELLLPVRAPTEGRFLFLVREAFASQLGLPDDESPRHFYQEFLYSLIGPVEERTTEAKKLGIWCFQAEISHRFRPWIPGIWPDGTDARIRELLTAYHWEGQEAAEIRYMCYEFGFGKPKRRTKEQMDEDLLIREAVGDDMKVRRRALANIRAWLVETHHELADLVRPMNSRG